MQIKLTLVVLFILSFFILSNNLDKPFVGIHDHNGARFGNIAKNYIKFWGESKFGPIEQKNIDGSFDYYTHYPSLLPLTIAGFYKIFGVSEFVTRLVPVIASVLTISFLFLFSINLWGYKVALFFTLFMIATPMFRYFGKNPVHEILVGLFGVLTFYGISKLLIGDKSKRIYILIFIASILSVLSGWGGYFVFPGVMYSFWKIKRKKKICFGYIAIMVFLYLGHFAYTKYLTESIWGGGLYEALLYRSSNLSQEFGVMEFINRLRLWSTTLFTISLLACASTIVFSFKGNRLKHKPILFFLLIFGGIYPLVFSNATYQHNYFIYNLLPVVSLCASLSIYAISSYFKKEFLYSFIRLIVVGAIYFERASFISSLQSSNQDNLAKDAGQEINLKVGQNQTILVTPAQYLYSRHPFLHYYGERTFVSEGYSNWILQVNDGKYTLTKNEY